MADRPGNVVVCGGGVIGACSAYYLGKRGVHVTVVDNCGVAAAASGKAGGFLALDWCDSSPLAKLARASFALHQQLATELNGAECYGYRRLDTLNVDVDEKRGPAAPVRTAAHIPAWVDGCSGRAGVIGTTNTTAQVHPRLFTTAIMSNAESRFGAKVIKGNVEGVKLDAGSSKVVGVMVDGELIDAEAVVIALGPWSGRLKLVSDLASISGLKAHSVVLRPAAACNEITPHALFLSYTCRDGKQMDPEVYPRPTGEVYVCGMSETVELPADAEQVQPRQEATAVLKRVAGCVSSRLTEGACQVEAEQACFLPLTPDGLPLIGQHPRAPGVYLAAGHSCWGILNAPGTGASLAQLIVDSVSDIVDLRPFDPARFL